MFSIRSSVHCHFGGISRQSLVFSIRSSLLTDCHFGGNLAHKLVAKLLLSFALLSVEKVLSVVVCVSGVWVAFCLPTSNKRFLP